MSSVRKLKKDINNIIGAFIQEVYIWELHNPNLDLKKSEQIIDQAIILFDHLVKKVSDCKKNGKKDAFKSNKNQLNSSISKLESSLKK